MTALKTMLFHDEITDNFDIASCTQKIASWDTIRSSSDCIQNSIINYCKGEVNSWSRIRFFLLWQFLDGYVCFDQNAIHCQSIEEAYSSPGSCAIESTVVKIKYFAARCIFNSLWSKHSIPYWYLTSISAQSLPIIYLSICPMSLVIFVFTDFLICYSFVQGGAT